MWVMVRVCSDGGEECMAELRSVCGSVEDNGRSGVGFSFFLFF